MNTKQHLIEVAQATARTLGPALGRRLPEVPKPPKPKPGESNYSFWNISRTLELDRSLQDPSLPRVTIRVGRTTFKVLADSRSLETFARRVRRLPATAFDKMAEPTITLP